MPQQSHKRATAAKLPLISPPRGRLPPRGKPFLSLGKPMKKPEDLLEWGGTKKDSTLPAFSRHMMQVSKINLTISMTLNRYSRA